MQIRPETKVPLNNDLVFKPLDKHEGARIRFRPENEHCLTQCVKPENILKLNPIISWAHFSQI